ncbi:hypothetical protein QQS21_004106 [Conoideocrella luteorostrata]|uniref:Uncharacterized protein n=1 Tax=Conoideocrella luteorostrata TaxID=1105319 RepID=A0AAJ0FVT9_9HYPO|nr:hypothetical protein QQS21_004106 [Conoideocrella luteorostrata]
MYLSKAAIACIAAAKFASAAPVVEQRADITDGDILNYALTLEHLENSFYSQGLDDFSKTDFANAGFDATFYNNLKKVSRDEAAHVSFLTTALKAAGVTPVAECEYDFGYKDVRSFVATASILEGVGVSAYLGAASKIMSKTYLTAAGSILTVEARHSSYLRAAQKQSPFPQSFDAPLSANQVSSLASQFITSCPRSNNALSIKAFPALTLDPKSVLVKAGSKVTFLTPGYSRNFAKGRGFFYAAFIAATGPTFVPAKPVDCGFEVEIPEGFAGQTYAVLTNRNGSISDETVAAGPALFEIS